MMNSRSHTRKLLSRSAEQRGVVLFFALVALVVMSLAAVALIRSVDTSTMIAGNLAFKQAATSSGDTGVEAAITWLETEQTAMIAAGKDVLLDADHTFNNTIVHDPLAPYDPDIPVWYYSSARPITDLTDGTVNWDETDSAPALTDVGGNVIADSSGNLTRYIIERMCRNPNEIPSNSNCLYSSNDASLNELKVKSADEVCQGAGCAQDPQSPQLRITAQVTGPRNTISYIQTFVY